MSHIVNKKISHIHTDYIESGNISKNTSSLKVPGGHVLINTKDALGRVKEELGIHTDAELAEALTVSIRRIHNWKQRNTVPTEAIVALCGSEGLDLEYILTGKKKQCDQKPANSDKRNRLSGFATKDLSALQEICKTRFLRQRTVFFRIAADCRRFGSRHKLAYSCTRRTTG